MTVKRRVVWMTDEDWTRIRGDAEGHGFTVSEYLRQLSHRELGHSTWSAVKAGRTGEPYVLKGGEGEPVHAASAQSAQQRRDAILRRVAKQ